MIVFLEKILDIVLKVLCSLLYLADDAAKNRDRVAIVIESFVLGDQLRLDVLELLSKAKD